MHQHGRVHGALFRARFVLPPHLSANVGSPAHPNELRTRKTFGVCRTRMPQCTCMDRPFRPHFAGARAKGKRSFRTGWQYLASFRTFGRSISDLQLICQISQLICDRMLALHDVPGRVDNQWMNGTMGPLTGHAWWIAGTRACTFDVHASQRETRNALWQRTGLPARPNELRRTSKTFGSSKMRTLFEFP